MSDYPKPIAHVDQIAPVPRRIRAVHGGEPVLDTTDALYVWEWPAYPQYYIPAGMYARSSSPPTSRTETSRQGTLRLYSFAHHGDGGAPPSVALVFVTRRGADWSTRSVSIGKRSTPGSRRTRRSSSTRAIPIPGWTPSARPARCGSSSAGSSLAESSSPVLVFETGLPTRYYLNRTEVRFAHLEPSPTVTSCPYKGTTTDYWSGVVGGETYPDLAWSYAFPTRQLLPISGLVAFYNEKVDLFVDGVLEGRPVTPFSDR